MQVALEIDFADPETSYRRVDELPIDRPDFAFSSGRKRAFASVFLILYDPSPSVVEVIKRELLADPEVRAVTIISEEEFWAAPSHAM